MPDSCFAFFSTCQVRANFVEIVRDQSTKTSFFKPYKQDHLQAQDANWLSRNTQKTGLRILWPNGPNFAENRLFGMGGAIPVRRIAIRCMHY